MGYVSLPEGKWWWFQRLLLFQLFLAQFFLVPIWACEQWPKPCFLLCIGDYISQLYRVAYPKFCYHKSLEDFFGCCCPPSRTYAWICLVSLVGDFFYGLYHGFITIFSHHLGEYFWVTFSKHSNKQIQVEELRKRSFDIRLGGTKNTSDSKTLN